MILPPKVIHPEGDSEPSFIKREISALVADTFDGKIHIEWKNNLIDWKSSKNGRFSFIFDRC